MRERAKLHLAVAAENEKTQPFNEKSMDFWVEHFGSQAASWVIWKHRDRLHRYGVVDFKIPRNVIVPPYFRVAMETLKTCSCGKQKLKRECKTTCRTKKWEVVMVGGLSNPQKTWRVRWLLWGDNILGPKKSLIES
jgi:hypothetical protein